MQDFSYYTKENYDYVLNAYNLEGHIFSVNHLISIVNAAFCGDIRLEEEEIKSLIMIINEKTK